MPAAFTQFTFIGGDLGALADAGAEQGFTVSSTEDGDGVVLTTGDIIDGLRWADFDDLMHGWAHEFGAEYQGWAAGPSAN